MGDTTHDAPTRDADPITWLYDNGTLTPIADPCAPFRCDDSSPEWSYENEIHCAGYWDGWRMGTPHDSDVLPCATVYRQDRVGPAHPNLPAYRVELEMSDYGYTVYAHNLPNLLGFLGMIAAPITAAMLTQLWDDRAAAVDVLLQAAQDSANRRQ